MRVNRGRRCGNSPKNRYAEDIAIAFEKRDKGFLDQVLDDNVSCELPGGEAVSRENLRLHFANDLDGTFEMC